jgi:hypothetical protein
MNLILPKTRANLGGLSAFPMFFLAGPILGGGDWQHAATKMLAQIWGGCVIVNPCRYGEEHPLYRHRLPAIDGAPPFERQTDWERHYLEFAAGDADHGCVIFWLPCQREPRSDGQPYARDTYGELGEWRGRMMTHPHLRVVVGAEPDFPGLNVIKRNFDRALGRDFPIAETLEHTVMQAITLARGI